MNTDLTLISLLPAFAVLCVGYMTHRVMLSLSTGIILAALIASNFAPWLTLKTIVLTMWNNLQVEQFFSSTQFWTAGNLFICLFLLVLGIFITMLQISGGAYAYSMFAKKKIKTAAGAETSSLVLSTGLFIDDYLSSLTTGAVMYPLTDTRQIPRAKLAFLVHSMACALTILCPFSSWGAAIIGFLGENGISETISKDTLIAANPFTFFIHVLPFLFYSFLVIASTWFIVRARISFGLMHKFETVAKTTGNLFGGATPPADKSRNIEPNPHHTTLLEFFVPIIVLLISVFSGFLYSGNWFGFGGQNSLLIALQQASAAAALFIGGNITLVICTIFFVLRKRIEIKQLPKVYWEGIKLMFSAAVVLILAWTFGDFLRNHLHTGEYLAGLMLNSVTITVLPMILFFAACSICFTIGSAWGTAAMMFPIVIPLTLTMVNSPSQPALEQVTILFPVLGAVLSGCVAGNNISPIADLTIMSSLSTHTKLKDHVHTQMQYALPGIFVTGFAFLLSGFLIPYGLAVTIIVPLITAFIMNMLILWTLSKRCR
jgi:Na+/H+ antiporter NhaC